MACILVECLTGAPPFAHEPPLLTMEAHLGEPPPRVSERNPRLPSALDAVVARGLAKEPAHRFATATALVDAAQAALAPAAAPAPAPAARPAPRPTRRRRRFRIPAWTAGVLAASAVAGFASGSADWSSPPPSPATERAAPDPALAAHADYVDKVRANVRRLAARRAALRDRLRQARHPARQAAAARSLAAAYRQARRALPRAPAGATAAHDLTGALRASEDAYRQLARAARHGDGAAWRTAAARAVRSEAQVRRALHRLAARQAALARSASQRSAA
jgi:hypothetical protein